MRIRTLIAMAAALLAAACVGTEIPGVQIEHASVDERASHHQLYTVSAEPIVVDNRTGWVNVKVQIQSALGTDSVAFNMIVR